MTVTMGHRRLATPVGAVVILLWSSSFAVARSLTEQLGALRASSYACLLGGILGMVYLAAWGGGLGRLRRLSWRRQAGRGAFFVAYEVCMLLATGLSASRQQVLEVGIINYLWPGLTLLLSVPVLGHRAKWTLLPGIAIAFTGVVLAATQEGFSLKTIGGRSASLPPYLLALAGAFCWAFYTNLSRKWTQQGDQAAVPLFILAAGAVLAVGIAFAGESSRWSPRAGAELAYMAAFPIGIAMLLWNFAVRHGNVAMLASLSHLTPLLSTGVSCLYLRVVPAGELWLACALVIGGAVMCRLSVLSPAAEG